MSIVLPDIVSTLEDSKQRRLYVLHREASGEWLSGYAPSGTAVFRIRAPTGFHFSYLTAHPTQGSAAVLRSATLIDGWFDWHFTISSDGKLCRGSPAY